jgi:hypothetical protein
MDEEMPQSIHVITIVIDPEANRPVVDIGAVPPHAAIVFFKQAAECLEATLLTPQIIYNGQPIFDCE